MMQGRILYVRLVQGYSMEYIAKRFPIGYYCATVLKARRFTLNLLATNGRGNELDPYNN
jgi:hypothetical protein